MLTVARHDTHREVGDLGTDSSDLWVISSEIGTPHRKAEAEARGTVLGKDLAHQSRQRLLC
jgi:hypothetical protein